LKIKGFISNDNFLFYDCLRVIQGIEVNVYVNIRTRDIKMISDQGNVNKISNDNYFINGHMFNFKLNRDTLSKYMLASCVDIGNIQDEDILYNIGTLLFLYEKNKQKLDSTVFEHRIGNKLLSYDICNNVINYNNEYILDVS